MHSKLTYVGWAAVAVSLFICIITTIISLNCLADKKTDCAQRSGFVGLVFSSLTVACIVVAVKANDGS